MKLPPHTLSAKELRTICTHDLLTPEEEKDLARKIKGGCKASLDRLVSCNIRLVVHHAKRFVMPRVTLGDAISIGTIGLMEAAKRFDPDKGTKFCTYATWWIREGLLANCWEQKSAIIHVPTYIQDIRRKLERGEPLKAKERRYLEQAEATWAPPTSIDGLTPEETPQEDLQKENLEIPPELLELTLTYLEKLTDADKYLLKARFGIAPYKRAMTLEEIAQIEGVTKERIRQKEGKAKERLRALILSHATK